MISFLHFQTTEWVPQERCVPGADTEKRWQVNEECAYWYCLISELFQFFGKRTNAVGLFQDNWANRRTLQCDGRESRCHGTFGKRRFYFESEKVFAEHRPFHGQSLIHRSAGFCYQKCGAVENCTTEVTLTYTLIIISQQLNTYVLADLQALLLLLLVGDRLCQIKTEKIKK